MIAIVDYKAGNIRSVANALGRLGKGYSVTSDPEGIRSADHVILPGVGSCRSAMDSLVAGGLAEVVAGLDQPVLGICVGLQLMCKSSEEGKTGCLGIFDLPVRRFPDSPSLKVPHMGWNTISGLEGPLFSGVEEGSFVYYVHSFYPELSGSRTSAVSEYGGIRFSGALMKDNFFGTQFHPEKSGAVGGRILANFVNL